MAAAALVVLGGVVAVAVGLSGREEAPSGGGGPTARVTRGELVVRLTESGEVEADKSKVIRNELQWPVIIKEVVEDGTRVAKGDKVLEFECQQLNDALVKARLEVNTTRNEHTRAENNLELKREETDANVRKAEDAVEEAKLNLKRYIEAGWPIQQQDVQTEIEIARRNLAVAQDQLELKLRINEDPVLKGLYSEKVIESLRFDVSKQRLALEKARAQKRMLEKYDDPQKRRELQTAVKDAELDLKRAKLEARNEVTKAESDLQAAKVALDTQQRELEKLLEQEKNLVVHAAEEGIVVYETGRRRRDDVTVAVGEKIQPRQQLMIIPDLTTLQIETKVFEAMYRLVEEGTPASVRLDADPDHVLPGKISWVAPTASRQHWYNPGVKVFDVIVQLDEIPEGLKPNMTADVEMVLARLDNVLQVPMAAVFTEQDKTWVWQPAGGGARKQPVEIGRSNDKRVQILSGLDEGDRVLLAPPASAG